MAAGALSSGFDRAAVAVNGAWKLVGIDVGGWDVAEVQAIGRVDSVLGIIKKNYNG